MNQNEFNWEKLPVWNEDKNGNFITDYDTEFKERFPTVRLSNWRDFQRFLDSAIFNEKKDDWIFRGQRNADWVLAPSIARDTLLQIVTEKMADEHLSNFKQALRGRIDDRALLGEHSPESVLELWSIGQHHGLKTPLLDFTYSPFIALYFAFSEIVHYEANKFRAVYCINKSAFEPILEANEQGGLRIVEPSKDDFGRLVNQDGLFLFSPIGESVFEALVSALEKDGNDDFENLPEASEADFLARKYLKIVIPNVDRDACIETLRRMNIHPGSLFPDVNGAAQLANILFDEKANDRRLKQEKDHADAIDSATPNLAVEIQHDKVSSRIPAFSFDALDTELKDVAFGDIENLPSVILTPEKSSNSDVVGSNILPNKGPQTYFQRKDIAQALRVVLKNSVEKFEFEGIVEDVFHVLSQDLGLDWEIRPQLIAKARIAVRHKLIASGLQRKEIEQVLEVLLPTEVGAEITEETLQSDISGFRLRKAISWEISRFRNKLRDFIPELSPAISVEQAMNVLAEITKPIARLLAQAAIVGNENQLRWVENAISDLSSEWENFGTISDEERSIKYYPATLIVFAIEIGAMHSKKFKWGVDVALEPSLIIAEESRPIYFALSELNDCFENYRSKLEFDLRVIFEGLLAPKSVLKNSIRFEHLMALIFTDSKECLNDGLPKAIFLIPSDTERHSYIEALENEISEGDTHHSYTIQTLFRSDGYRLQRANKKVAELLFLSSFF